MNDLTDRMDKLMAVVKGLESNMNKRFDTLSGAVLGIYECLEWYKAFIDSLSGDEDAFDREAAGFQAETCCKFQTETTRRRNSLHRRRLAPYRPRRRQTALP